MSNSTTTQIQTSSALRWIYDVPNQSKYKHVYLRISVRVGERQFPITISGMSRSPNKKKIV